LPRHIDVAMQAMGTRFPQRLSRAPIACHRGISSRCSRRSCAAEILKGIRGPRGGYELARDRVASPQRYLACRGTVEDNDKRMRVPSS